MDFDPSAFLSMAMTEDQDVEYTAPDVPQGFSPAKVLAGNIVVEGGLQMENGLQIPVPVFGLLQDEPMEEERKGNDNDSTKFEDPIHIDTTEQEAKTMQQDSPVERTLSPCTKKVIHTSLEETRFRRELFGGHFERVKIFRLHCTICDKHLGCAPWFTERQMRTHKLLNVVVCRKCFEFYGDINFPIEDGSELFCCWCGEGGECFCCNTCPKIVCKKCVKRNFGAAKVKEIDQNDDWSCFVCKPEDIWPHRALMVGMQRWSRGLRQRVAMLSKEEKQTKLSMDTSHCCLGSNKEFRSVSLPTKAVLSRIPLEMIAFPYQASIREELTTRVNAPVTILSPRVPETMIRVKGCFSERLPRAMAGYHVRQQVQQVVQRNALVMNRPPPYSINRNILPTTQPHQFTQRIVNFQQNALPHNILPPLVPISSPDVIDVDRDSPVHGHSKLPLIDISSLERDVKEVKDILKPTSMMLDHFDVIKSDLVNDFSKMTTYYDRLSYNIKIAICNLAKINTELIENQKKIIDKRVSSVVHNIQSTVNNEILAGALNNVKPSIINGSFNRIHQNGIELSSKISNSVVVVNACPEIIQVEPDSPSQTPEMKTSDPDKIEHASPAVTSSSTEEIEDVAIAMLCETVLEENKENKDDANKDPPTPAKESQRVINKGTHKQYGRKRTRSPEIQVIDLIDDEEEKQEKFDETLWRKKFNIASCKVVLERVEILKVDVE